MIYVLLVIIILAQSVLIYVLAKRGMVLNDKMEDINDQVDESLVLLERCYVSIEHASKTPVLSDEPFVKKLMSDILTAKHAVVMVMNKMGEFDQEEALDETDQSQG